MSYASILVRREGPAAIITLNRPERRNAISQQMMGEIMAAAQEAEADPAVRSLILTGGTEVHTSAGPCLTKKKPYNSWGNGSAMRTSPIGFYFNEENLILEKAREFAVVTHNHPHGISGAQAVSLSIFLARNGSGKEEIRTEISNRLGYDLSKSLSDIRPSYQFDVSCQGSVPQAIINASFT